MKILIADKLADEVVVALRELGAEVTIKPDLNADTLVDHIGDAEILIVRSTEVRKPVMDQAKALSLIIRAGAGVNTIDVNAANDYGIHVANTPGKNNIAVAELAIGMLVAADRRIADATQDLRDGKWKKKEYGKARGLKGRTLGVIGLGAIGLAVAQRARGLEMEVVTYTVDYSAKEVEKLGIKMCSSVEELARISDMITVHIPATPTTKGMFNAAFFKQMKNGAIFINTSRGQVVNTQDLLAAIKEKGLRVALDVFENEPEESAAAFNHQELAKLVTCTPHIGASTEQATEAVAEEVVRIVDAYQKTGKPLHSVNLRQKSPAPYSLVVRHFNQIGVLAGILNEIRAEDINIEEMENTIFASGKAASCALKLDEKPSAALLARISAKKEVIQAILK